MANKHEYVSNFKIQVPERGREWINSAVVTERSMGPYAIPKRTPS